MFLSVILLILLCHFIFDFVLQTHKQAVNKSSSNIALFSHVITYSVCWFPIMYILQGSIGSSFIFCSITFICHLITDYFTSRINTKLLRNNPDNYHWFFIGIGFDQFLHYAQLFILYYFLF